MARGLARERIMTVHERTGCMGKVRSPINGKDGGVGYLEACRLIRGKGVLPPHVLSDDYYMALDKAKGMEQLEGAWPREILAFPEKGGVFKRGEDIGDFFTKWVIPASAVPPEAFGVRGIGLFVDPEDLIEEHGWNRRVIIHPRSIVVLASFLQASGYGRVDETTRIPLEVGPDELKTLSPEKLRWLEREDCLRVGPLARGFVPAGYIELYGDYDWRHLSVFPGISATCRPDIRCRVAYLRHGGPPSVGRLIKDADASLEELSHLLPPERIRALKRLVRRLTVQE